MIRLFLLRHGNTFETGQTPVQIGAKTDLPLTNKGREQAAAFAQFMTQLPTPAAIYAGSLKRQIETAQIVAQALHAETLLHLNEEALTEIDYGA
ncbi:MAG: histidine phosphatase family protein, partial [Candidatus Marsarchaeota archaeon]|nr:histidine phosphatase family protein [Candidatus Marsarchaeota archaeon]